MGALTLIGSGLGAYIMAIAVLSPCPLLVHETSGGVIIVSNLSRLHSHTQTSLSSCSLVLKNEQNVTETPHVGCQNGLKLTCSAPQVLAWVLFVLTLSYVKVIIGVILRDEGHSALVWCGAVVQLGSLLGAVTMFPVVSVYSFFSSGDPCNTKCP